MFRDANTIAGGFILPILISQRHVNGKCTCPMGTITVINDKGWFITAAHMFAAFFGALAQVGEAKRIQEERSAIEQDKALSHKVRQQKLFKAGKAAADAVTNVSAWFGRDGIIANDIGSNNDLDLAWGRLEPFDPAWITTFPTFKNPDINFSPGASLCKLGFPFHEVTPLFDTATGAFTLPPEAFPLPFFPIEEIFTRTLVLPDGTTPSAYPRWLVETSSPGLKGQSGGPIFDSQGRVWAMQTRTVSYGLGFVTNQFLHAGQGVHAIERGRH